ncbi:MAG: hypothetical protein KIT09_06825 [Bryobacteraceae bacterium]|nr:hypothetical protein [Bryobacteraceae bacterium]
MKIRNSTIILSSITLLLFLAPLLPAADPPPKIFHVRPMNSAGEIVIIGEYLTRDLPEPTVTLGKPPIDPTKQSESGVLRLTPTWTSRTWVVAKLPPQTSLSPGTYLLTLTNNTNQSATIDYTFPAKGDKGDPGLPRVIQDEGTSLPGVQALNFTGDGIECKGTGNTVNCAVNRVPVTTIVNNNTKDYLPKTLNVEGYECTSFSESIDCKSSGDSNIKTGSGLEILDEPYGAHDGKGNSYWIGPLGSGRPPSDYGVTCSDGKRIVGGSCTFNFPVPADGNSFETTRQRWMADHLRLIYSGPAFGTTNTWRCVWVSGEEDVIGGEHSPNFFRIRAACAAE